MYQKLVKVLRLKLKLIKYKKLNKSLQRKLSISKHPKFKHLKKTNFTE